MKRIFWGLLAFIFSVISLTGADTKVADPETAEGNSATKNNLTLTSIDKTIPNSFNGADTNTVTANDGQAEGNKGDFKTLKSTVKLPLMFEENIGQYEDKDAKFVTRNKSSVTSFSNAGATFRLLKKVKGQNDAVSSQIQLSFAGSNKETSVIGIDELSTKVNHYQGTDKQNWKTDIKTFSRIGYKDVYEGIDVVFYGNPQSLEYDFVVSPGASPDRIKLKFDGVKELKLDKEGNLVLRTKLDTDVIQKKLEAYQEISGKREQVTSAYEIDKKTNEVSLRVGKYDNSKTLVIDPTVIYSTYFGFSDIDVTVDAVQSNDGYFVYSGYTKSLNIPTVNALQPNYGGTIGGYGDALLVKLNPKTGDIAFLTYLGGSKSDKGEMINVSPVDGSIYFAVNTESSDFPITANAIQPTYLGQNDGAFGKLDKNGKLLYSSYFGTAAYDTIKTSLIDANGNIHLVGESRGTFPNIGGGFQPTRVGESDIYIATINPSLNSVVSLNYFGGGKDEYLTSAKLFQDKIVLYGNTNSANFPLVKAYDFTFQDVLSGLNEDFVASLSTSGTKINFSTYLGGSSMESNQSFYSNRLGIGKDGSIFVTGLTRSSDIPVKNALNPTMIPFEDLYYGKFTIDGELKVLSYFNLKDGFVTSDKVPYAINQDDQGNVFLVGGTMDGSRIQGFTPSSPSQFAKIPTDNYNGYTDLFVAYFNSNLDKLYYTTVIGGKLGDVITSANYNSEDGLLYLAGATSSQDFPLVNTFQNTRAGSTPFVDDFILLELALTPPAPMITSPINGSDVADNTPTISGTSVPNATIKVLEGFVVLGTTTADASGNWTLPATSSLDKGVHIITATAGFSGKNYDSNKSTEISFKVITDPPKGNAEENKFVINGGVKFTNGQPASGAEVRAGGVSTITNPDGSFSLPGLPNGTYEVIIVGSNGVGLGKKTVVISGANVSIEIIASSLLVDQVYSVWNTFLDQSNVIVLTNKGNKIITVVFDVLNKDGGLITTKEVAVAAHGVTHIDTNSFINIKNSYGYFKIGTKDPMDISNLSGQTVLSRIIRGKEQFTITKAFENFISSASRVVIDTSHPSLARSQFGHLAAEFLQLVNVSKSEQSYKLTSYNENGLEVLSRNLTLFAGQRADVDGGHVAIGRNHKGSISITPLAKSNGGEVQYLAQEHTYFYDNAMGKSLKSLSGALGDGSSGGLSSTQYAFISTISNARPTLVLTNTVAQSNSVAVELIGNNGKMISSETLILPANGQREIRLFSKLKNSTGVVRVTPELGKAIKAVVKNYFYNSKKMVSASYLSPLNSVYSGSQFSNYNTFSKRVNRLRIFNTAEVNASAVVKVYSQNGNVVGQKTFALAPHTGQDLEFKGGLKITPANNSYGAVEVASNIDGAIVSEVVQYKMNGKEVDIALATSAR